MANTRKPTKDESERWERYRNSFDRKTKPVVDGLLSLGGIAIDAQREIEEITGKAPNIITQDQLKTLATIEYRAQILNRQINGVLTHKYAVQFDDENQLNIVGATAAEGDIYPSEDMSLGLAPIIIAAGIFAVTLLMSGDAANDALEKKAKIEALKLQQRMLQADKEMMFLPESQRKQWEDWKKKAASAAKIAASQIPDSESWLDKFFGRKSTTILTAGAVGIAALYFLLPKLRRN